MNGGTEEKTLQKPELISTGCSYRQSIWSFRSGRLKSQSNINPMAVAVPPLEESFGSRQPRDDNGRQKVEEYDDKDGSAECGGCKKIWKEEGRKRDPISVVPSLNDNGKLALSARFLNFQVTSAFAVAPSTAIEFHINLLPAPCHGSGIV
jgi:hypothetical protein